MNSPSFISVCALIALGVVARADTAYVATRDGDVSIQCMCIARSAGCDRRFFDAASGGNRVSWSQPAHLLGGHSYNLDELCYRKRDVDGGGAGLCCETSDEKSAIEHLFRGKVNP